MDAVSVYCITVSVLLLLSAHLTCGQTIPTECEEGANVSFTFNVTYTGFGVLLLKRNNDEIYQNDGKRTRVETGTFVSLSTQDTVMFTLDEVKINDSGIYKCFFIGLEKSPTYNLQVISSEKFIGISKKIDNWDPYELNDSVAAIEGSTFKLACRVYGGLRSDCLIRWRIENVSLPSYTENVTACSRYHEEILIEINPVTVNLDGSRITCQSGELNTWIYMYVTTKRKPRILYQENEFTEGLEYQVTCVLTATSQAEQPRFHWSLDNKNITENATQQRNEIAEGNLEWISVLTLFPNRQHFEKLLQCIISNDEDRSDSLALTIEFAATIRKIFASPSQFVDAHSSVNITCVATGFPQLKLFWLKSCEKAECLIVPHEPLYHNLSETTFSSTLVLMDVNKSDGGSYKCKAFNGIGLLAEEAITIHVEEQGILVEDSTRFFENQPVNISCQVTQAEPLTFIRWTLDHEVDVTSNATQYEVQNRRNETVIKSTLMFYPKRAYNGSDLTCQWGSQQISSDTIFVNISHAAQQESVFRIFPFTPAVQIAIIAIPLGLLFIVISIMLFVCRSRRKRNANMDMMNPKCPDRIGIHTLTAINAGNHPHVGGSNNVLYEDMACYTTEVISSECSDDLHDDYQFSMDNFSCDNDENESRMKTTIVPNNQCSLGDKLWTLFGQDFGTETKQKGNRLSMHIAMEDDSRLLEHEDDSQLRKYNMKDINNEPDNGFILTIHSKLTQRGCIFFCNATVARNDCSMNVTVKVLSEFSHRDEKSLFKKEMSIVKNLDSHPNIAEVLGICCSSQPNCVILEKISEENLKGVLLQNDTKEELSETTENLRQYAEQVCSGMVFLSKNEYYHPNLRCENVAVAKQGTCKLYDFVPAETFSAQDSDSQQRGFVAPEIVEGKKHTCHTEVWEFGVLLLEIYCYGLNNIKDANRTNIYGQFIGLDSLQRPESLPRDMYNVVLRCRCDNPPNRPSFSALLDDIKRMKCKPTISTTV